MLWTLILRGAVGEAWGWHILRNIWRKGLPSLWLYSIMIMMIYLIFCSPKLPRSVTGLRHSHNTPEAASADASDGCSSWNETYQLFQMDGETLEETQNMERLQLFMFNGPKIMMTEWTEYTIVNPPGMGFKASRHNKKDNINKRHGSILWAKLCPICAVLSRNDDGLWLHCVRSTPAAPAAGPWPALHAGEMV